MDPPNPPLALVSLSSSTLSRLTRLPKLNVDLWQLILADVICCPLLPSQGDNLINSLKLLTDDCELAAEWAQSERVRVRLREVCRSWKGILDRFSHRFLIITDDVYPPPLASRVQYPATDDCECRLRPCRLNYSAPSAGSGRSIEAYIDIAPARGRKLMDLVKQHRHLRLLATAVDLFSHESPFSLSALSSACQGLTHLSLSELYIPKSPHDQTLHLPRLHTLALSFSSPAGKETISHPSFQLWELPNLQNLALKGGVWTSDPSFFGHIDALLIKLGPNLRGLLYNLWIFAPREADTPRPIPSALWDWCPNLHTIQTSLKTLFSGPRPSRNHPRLTFVPVHLDNLDALPDIGRLLWSPELFEQLPDVNEWPIARSCVTMSWSTFYRKLRSIHETRNEDDGDSSYWPRFFCKWIDLLLSRGYAVQDRHEVSVRDLDGLLEWLGNFREAPAVGALSTSTGEY